MFTSFKDSILFHSLAFYRTLSYFFFFFSSTRRHTRLSGDWSSDVCSSDLCRSSEDVDTILSNLAGLRFLDTTFSTWKRAGELSASLRRKGVTLPVSDLIIGALAIEHGYPVYTLDGHFRHIPGLTLYAPPRSSSTR